MTNLTRRKFIKITAVASVSLSPVTTALASYLGSGVTEVEDALFGSLEDDPRFHLIDNNLINLHFYFLNIRKKKRDLIPGNANADSFMIVRLPQQHVSEAGFWAQNWTDRKNNKPKALLSGFSYLAFQVWPTDKPRDKPKLRFSLENLLDWNNENNFRLITLLDWLKLQNETEFKFFTFDRDRPGLCEDFKTHKIWTKNAAEADIFKRYESIVRQLFNKNFSEEKMPFFPITFFEVPHEVCLVPIPATRETEAAALAVKKRFWKNQLLPKPKKKGTRKYEVWSNALFYERPKTVANEVDESGKSKFVYESPSFRIAGLISDKTLTCEPYSPPPNCSEPTNPNASNKLNDIIPTFLTKAELTHLTQYAKQGLEDRLSTEYDIKALNNFIFSGLGVFAHLKYESTKNLPAKIDLIEYEHRIVQGRDVFVKVARLGYNSKTGQKYKHVIEGKRKIHTEAKTPIDPQDPPLASFIELKQYCECIEDEIVYTQLEDKWGDQSFVKFRTSVGQIQKPMEGNACHFRRGTFKSLRIKNKKRIPIDCLRNEIAKREVCVLEDLDWFWVIKEGALETSPGVMIPDKDVPIERYVPCEYEATDWEDASQEASTPFMFIRRAYVQKVSEGAADPHDANRGAYYNYLKGNYAQQNPRDPLVERKLTHFKSKMVAFTSTPPNPPAALVKQGVTPEYDSKTNVLETEYVESYFNLKNLRHPSDPDFGKSIDVRYVVFPQILRARVFLDHIRDLAQKKIASVIEYDDHYIKGSFILNNPGKLILRHTEAYKRDFEEPLNKTYNTIKTALQQAKNQLGNLVVPDIIPDVISLDVSGITLPPDIQDRIDKGQVTIDTALSKLKDLNPRAFLRGKVSEILGGIDLNAILDELIPQENTPLFELKKLTNEIEKISSELANSPVYKGILEQLNSIKEKITSALENVNRLLKEIKDFEAQVNGLLRKISEAIPNSDELDSLVKNLFERFRTRFFDVVLENIDFSEVKQKIDAAKINVLDFLKTELNILKLEYQSRLVELGGLMDEVLAEIQNELPQFPADLRRIATLKFEDYFDRELGALYHVVVNGQASPSITVFNNYEAKVEALFRTVADNVPMMAGSDPVYYRIIERSSATPRVTLSPEITWELVKRTTPGAKQLFDLTATAQGPGFVQLQKKINDFRTLVAGNIQATSDFHVKAVNALLSRINSHQQTLDTLRRQVEQFQTERLEPISKNIREWRDAAERFRANPAADPRVKDAVRRVQELVLKANSHVDFLRRVDPYFYYREQERLKKDVLDIRRRFSDKLAVWFGTDVFDNVPACGAHFTSIACEVKKRILEYKELRDKLYAYAINPTVELRKLKEYVEGYQKLTKEGLDQIGKRALEQLNDTEIAKALIDLRNAKDALEARRNTYKTFYDEYLRLVRVQAEELGKRVTEKIEAQIEVWERELASQIDPATISELQTKINEARNIFRLLTSIKQQDLSYKWSTTNFHDVNLGILTFKKFTAPDTRLAADVKITTHFTPGKFPPAIEKITTSSSNRLTNFGVGFFNVLTIGFSEASFLAASGESPRFAVKIKDVKFDGSLSFVQAFEKWMAGKGLVLRLEADRLILGYSLALPSIQTPGFAFFNLSLNFDIRLYFDNRPMRFGFSFARPDLKFGIAAGIYAGFGFFGLVGEPKRGIVEMDAALEAGVWKGIKIGPISGEVKLAFGFRYTRSDSRVRLEGYIVAEGRLSVWIIEISARIYLGVVSENSYVEGRCTVTYSAKLGFVKKSFSGSFHQKIAGAKPKNNEETAEKMAVYTQKLMAFLGNPIPDISALQKSFVSIMNEEPAGDWETKPVSLKSWRKFARVM